MCHVVECLSPRYGLARAYREVIPTEYEQRDTEHEIQQCRWCECRNAAARSGERKHCTQGVHERTWELSKHRERPVEEWLDHEHTEDGSRISENRAESGQTSPLVWWGQLGQHRVVEWKRALIGVVRDDECSDHENQRKSGYYKSGSTSWVQH